MVAGRPLAEAPWTANVYVMRLDEAVSGVSLVIASRCGGDGYRSRLGVRPGAFLPSFLL